MEGKKTTTTNKQARDEAKLYCWRGVIEISVVINQDNHVSKGLTFIPALVTALSPMTFGLHAKAI